MCLEELNPPSKTLCLHGGRVDPTSRKEPLCIQQLR